ncbi:hypothetical protein SAMN02745898_10914 [Streptomyces sp. 136MFCol5.1]|nr:hypothetical protein SAMN02745898_10914 [Streptomyces sp. 136MFCol5.1]
MGGGAAVADVLGAAGSEKAKCVYTDAPSVTAKIEAINFDFSSN